MTSPSPETACRAVADIDAFLADMNKREAASRQALIDRILALSPEGRRAAADQALEFLIASVRGKDRADATFFLLMAAGAGEYAQSILPAAPHGTAPTAESPSGFGGGDPRGDAVDRQGSPS